MSQIALSPPAGGTGVFTIAAPATNTNQTLTLPDATGTVLATASPGTAGQFLQSNGASPPTFVPAPAAGVTSLTAGAGISVSASTGAVTVSNIAPAGPAGAFVSMQVFTASGTYTKPAGLVRVKVTVIGGGGGSNGGGSSFDVYGQPAPYRGNNSGAGGGASINVVTAASLATTTTVTVGAGGVGGAPNSNPNTRNPGSAGGTSSFGTFASATGGAGGTADVNSGITINGGSGSGGLLNYGGGSVFPGGVIALIGGSAPLGGCSAIQSAGRSYGGGGTPSVALNVAGLAGAAGVVIIEEFF